MGAYTYSTTAASNTSIDGLGNNGAVDPPSNIDNLVGRLAAAQAAFVRDLGGANTVAGTADAITVSLADPSTVSAYFDGMVLSFRAASDTTSTAPTLNVDSIGAKAIKKAVAGVESALVAGDIQAGGTYTVVYRSAWATAAGAFELLNPYIAQELFVGSASAGSGVAPFGVYSVNESAAFGRFAASASGPVLRFQKSRNATVGSHTIAQSGDVCGVSLFSASDGTSFIEAARISAEVDGTPGTNDMPGRLVFRTTADGAAASTERWVIDSSGRFKPNANGTYDIGTTALAVYTVHAYNVYFVSSGVTLIGPADASSMEIAGDNAVYVTPLDQHRHPSAAKVWGMTTGGGTPTLSGSYNMTSITDVGTGIITLTFATDFSNALWGGSAIAATTTNAGRMCNLVTRQAGNVNLESSSAAGTLADPGAGYNWAFFGDQ